MESTLLIALLAIALLLAVIALVRQVRLRRALQKLLTRLINLWRTAHVPKAEHRSAADHDPDPVSGAAGHRMSR